MTPRRAPSPFDVLFALAASLEAGANVSETFRLLARAGPASAQVARRLSEGLRNEPLAAVLAHAELITVDDRAIIQFGEETGRLPAALRWAAERARVRDTRRRAIRAAVVGPLLFAVAGLLLDQLPGLFLGTSFSWWTALRPAVELGGASALALWGMPRVLALPLRRARSLALRLPFIGGLVQLEGEAKIAALIAAFAEAADLGLTPRAAKTIGAEPWDNALAAVAAEPLSPVPSFAEPFALALVIGQSARDLPTRFALLHGELETKLTARLRTIARAIAFTILGLIAAQSIRKLMSSPLPGLNLDLGGGATSPEMKELERELDNLSH